MKLLNNSSCLKNKKKVVLFDIDYTLFDTDSFRESSLKRHLLYNEVEDVLKSLSKFADLGIFSEGESKFQKNKLRKTNIRKYFNQDHIYIIENKEADLEKILSKYRNRKLFLIDDKLTVLCVAKTYLQTLFTIWVKRGKYAENQKPIKNFTPNVIIDNLLDIVTIINSNN